MVQFHQEFKFDEIKNFQKLANWIISSIEHYNLVPGELNFIFLSDNELLEINRKHLAHDFYTDVITFDYRVGEIISGDIYISIERVRDNALKYQEDFVKELCRVIIHGVLHLVGYDDKSLDKEAEMRKQEELLLNLCPIL